MINYAFLSPPWPLAVLGVSLDFFSPTSDATLILRVKNRGVDLMVMLGEGDDYDPKTTRLLRGPILLKALWRTLLKY